MNPIDATVESEKKEPATSTPSSRNTYQHPHHDQVERARIWTERFQQQETIGEAGGDLHGDLHGHGHEPLEKLEKEFSVHHELKRKNTEPDPEAGAPYLHPHHDELELDRILTSQLQQQQTVGSTHEPEVQEQWLPMGAAKPYPPSLPDWEAYVVEFEGSDDPMHPQNWPMGRR